MNSEERSEGETWRLDLPFTVPPLKDNGRMHWAEKARHTAQLRRDAAILARAAHLPRNVPRVRVELHWQPGTRRRRDVWGAAPSLKPLVDGLVDYGLTVDDDVEHVLLGCHVHPWQRGVRAGCWLIVTPVPAPTKENA